MSVNALGLLAQVWLKLGDPKKASDFYKEEVALARPARAGARQRARSPPRSRRPGGEARRLERRTQRQERGRRPLQPRIQDPRRARLSKTPATTWSSATCCSSFKTLGTFHLLHRKDPAAALVFYRKALVGFDRRLKAEPENVVAQEQLAVTHYYVATAALRAGDRKSADLHYKACLDLREALAVGPKDKVLAVDVDLMIARAPAASTRSHRRPQRN